MSNLTFSANICDHMIYDGACECNERRVEGEEDFLTTFMAEVAEVVPRSLFRNPDGPADIVEYDPRPTQMDLAVIGSMAFCGIRNRLRREAGIDASENDKMEFAAAMNVAQRNPTLLHSTEEFKTLFEAEMAKLEEQAQVDEHLEDERLEDEADQDRLNDYLNDVAEEATGGQDAANDGHSCASEDEEEEDQAYLDACDAMSYNYEDRIGSPTNCYPESNYYDESYSVYEN